MIMSGHNDPELRFHISRSDYLNLSPNWHDDNATLSTTRLYFIESGAGYLTFDDQTYPLEPGFVYLIPSHFQFGYGCTGMKKLYFHIRITATNPIDILSSIGTVLKLPYKKEVFENLVRCYNATDLFGRLQLQSLLMQVLCEFANAHSLQPLSLGNYSDTIRQSISYIQAAPSLKHTAKSIAQQLFISESRLRNAFRKELGITIGNFIDLCVFRQAKALLRTTMSLEQISQQLGFCDQFYFSRRFKQRHGLTPSQYRKQFDRVMT